MTIVVWAAAAVWTNISVRADVERVLDGRLIEAARMVAALDTPAGPRSPTLGTTPYSRQLSCQIWSLEGALIGQSAGAPDEPLAAGAPGFSDKEIAGEQWRVFTYVDKDRGIRVMVGDSLGVRQRLVNDLILGLLLPAVVGLTILALMLWFGVRGGLSPLNRVTRAIEQRTPQSLAPLGTTSVPDELAPLVEAMNDLLARLNSARQLERDFVANAAHELQTPLAGLKIQAEVARRASDNAMREKALDRISQSVDRASRLVTQLLMLARHEGREIGQVPQFIRLWDAASHIAMIHAHRSEAMKKPIIISRELSDVEIAVETEALQLALGNLVENSLLYAAEGEILIGCSSASMFELTVTDAGPGIPSGDVDRLRRRFERGSDAKAQGSGLGLSIVEAAIGPSEGELLFRADHNFSAIIRFPLHRVRSARASDGNV